MSSLLSSISGATSQKISGAMDEMANLSKNMDVTDIGQMNEMQMKTMILTTSVQLESSMTKAIGDALKSVTQRIS